VRTWPGWPCCLWRGDHSPAAHGDGGKEIALALVVLALTIVHLVIALSIGASLGQGERAGRAEAKRPGHTRLLRTST
jgi:hypothetical protein